MLGQPTSLTSCTCHCFCQQVHDRANQLGITRVHCACSLRLISSPTLIAPLIKHKGMQSPVLDPCLASSEDLGFLDLFDETAGAPGKSMDLEICLDHLGGYQPASRPGGRCRTVVEWAVPAAASRCSLQPWLLLGSACTAKSHRLIVFSTLMLRRRCLGVRLAQADLLVCDLPARLCLPLQIATSCCALLFDHTLSTQCTTRERTHTQGECCAESTLC